MYKKFKKWLAKNIFYMYSYPDLEADVFLPSVGLTIFLIAVLTFMFIKYP